MQQVHAALPGLAGLSTTDRWWLPKYPTWLRLPQQDIQYLIKYLYSWQLGWCGQDVACWLQFLKSPQQWEISHKPLLAKLASLNGITVVLYANASHDEESVGVACSEAVFLNTAGGMALGPFGCYLGGSFLVATSYQTGLSSVWVH